MCRVNPTQAGLLYAGVSRPAPPASHVHRPPCAANRAVFPHPAAPPNDRPRLPPPQTPLPAPQTRPCPPAAPACRGNAPPPAQAATLLACARRRTRAQSSAACRRTPRVYRRACLPRPQEAHRRPHRRPRPAPTGYAPPRHTASRPRRPSNAPAKPDVHSRLLRFALAKCAEGQGVSNPCEPPAGDRGSLSREFPTNSRARGLRLNMKNAAHDGRLFSISELMR